MIPTYCQGQPHTVEHQYKPEDVADKLALLVVVVDVVFDDAADELALLMIAVYVIVEDAADELALIMVAVDAVIEGDAVD